MTFIAITLILIDKIWVEEERERERARSEHLDCCGTVQCTEA